MIVLTAPELATYVALGVAAGVLLAAACPRLSARARALLIALARAVEGRPVPDRSRYRPPSPIRRIDRVSR